MADTNGNAGAKSGAGTGPVQVQKTKGLIFKEAAEKALGGHAERIGTAVTNALKGGIIEPLTGTLDELDAGVKDAHSKADAAASAAEKAGKAVDGLRTDARGMVEQAETRVGKDVKKLDEKVGQVDTDGKEARAKFAQDVEHLMEQIKDVRESVAANNEQLKQNLTTMLEQIELGLGEFKTELETANDKKITELQSQFDALKIAVDGMSEELKAVNCVEISLKDGEKPSEMTLPNAIHVVLAQVQTIRSALDGYGKDASTVETRIRKLEESYVDKKMFDEALKGVRDDFAELSIKVDDALRQLDAAVTDFRGFVSKMGAFFSGLASQGVNVGFGENTDELPSGTGNDEPNGNGPKTRGPTPGSAAAA